MSGKPLPTEVLRAHFLIRANARFADQVTDFRLLREWVCARTGTLHNDHGAIRCADPRQTRLFERACGLMGLVRNQRYDFPAKKLRSFDLQVPGTDAGEFKIFVSQLDLSAFPPAVAALIADDCAAQFAAADHRAFVDLLDRAERDGGLDDSGAEHFLDHLLGVLMRRNGPPPLRRTLEAVAEVSGAAASALALGPDFNHLTIDVRAAGFDGIDAMADAMRAAGFVLLPDIQGAPGTPLRQTATMADSRPIPVLEADGRIGTMPVEQQFVEIIERNLYIDADGRRRVYAGFLATNAEQIFSAASLHPSSRPPPA